MENKIFFSKGDVVVVKQPLSFKPVMVVKHSSFSIPHFGNKSKFLGVVCWWYTLTGEYQEQRFNSKDLEYYEQIL